MAVDKLVDSTQLNADLTSVANAIRTKGGTSAQLAFPAGFVSAVEAIPTGGGGGSQLTKLTEINVTQDVRSVAITPASSWWDYDYILINYNLTLSNSDWLYFSKTDLSGGHYTSGRVTDYKDVTTAYKYNGNLRFQNPNANGNDDLSSGDTFYIYMYNASNTITSGSSIGIYGGYKNDL